MARLSRFLFLLVLFVESFVYADENSISNASYSHPRIEEAIETISQSMDEGALNIAYCLIQNCLKRKDLKKENRYLLLKYLSKVHYLQEDMMHYNRACYDAWKLKRNDGEIYKALYFAEKSNYWHFYYVSDSTVKYARLAMRILKKNWRDREKVPYYSIYQSYGTSFLHNWGIEIKPSMSPMDIGIAYQRKINVYLDSALYHLKSNQFVLNLDKAIIYRSKGNRLLDLLDYNFKTKKQFQMYSPYSDSIKRVILSYYNQSIKELNPKNVDFRCSILNLKALTYFISGDLDRGNAIVNKIYETCRQSYGVLSNTPNIKNILTTLSYKLKANIKLDPEKYVNNCKVEEQILTNLLAVWKTWLSYERNNTYDIYHNSPFQNLSILLLNKYRYKKKYYILKKACQLAFNDYYLTELNYDKNASENLRLRRAKFEFRSINSKEFRLKINRVLSIFEFTNCKRSNNKLVQISNIQNKLTKNEAFIFHLYSSLLSRSKQFVITRDSICSFDFDFQPASLENLEKASFQEFKTISFKLYQNYYQPIYKSFPNLKRVYVGSKNVTDFSWFVSDSVGENYDNLNFLGRKINFVYVHNPVEYFNSKPIFLSEKILVATTKSDGLKQFRNLEALFKLNENQLFTRNQKTTNINDVLINGNSIHFVGHGILKQNEYLAKDSKTNNIPTSSSGNLINIIKGKKDFKNHLLIFSNCYSGKNNYGFKFFDMNFYNALLSKGVKSVIVSDGLAEDESSAYIFKRFYNSLYQGNTIENALFEAKNSYLKGHSGSRCNPLFWANYKLISNARNVRLSSSFLNDSTKKFNIYKVLFPLIGLFLLVLIKYRRN